MSSFNSQKMKQQRGFSIIELLVVVTIIGVLAGIAITQFAAYRQNAYITSAKADLRNMITLQEVYFLENEVFLECSDISGGSGPSCLASFSDLSYSPDTCTSHLVEILTMTHKPIVVILRTL